MPRLLLFLTFLVIFSPGLQQPAAAIQPKPPVVQTISPGLSPLAGRKVTIVGKSFSNVQKVTFGKVKGSNLQVLSATKLTVRAPAVATPRTVPVKVVLKNGLVSSVTVNTQFTYLRYQLDKLTSVGGNGHSFTPSVDNSGNLIAFASDATDLVPGDTNGQRDIFVKNLNTGLVQRIGGNYGSYNPSLAGNGSKVTFYSAATDLVPNDSNGQVDVFVYDFASQQFSRFGGNGNSNSPVLSEDGNKLAFISAADDLVESDTNGYADVFVADLRTGVLSRFGGSGSSYGRLSFSADSSKVVFASDAYDLVVDDTNESRDLFVQNLVDGTVLRVGGEANSYSRVMLSSSGERLAFTSDSAGLLPGDTDGFSDVFVKNLVTGNLIRVGGDGDSLGASLSADGNKLIFYSWATNLVANDTNGLADIFVRDLATGVTTRIATASNSFAPVISGTGRNLAFVSLRSASPVSNFDVFVASLK